MKAKTDHINREQMTFLEDDVEFPSTRFQGSKLKIVDWIWEAIKDLNFNSMLDAFGGTGSVGYFLKCKEKEVTYNDILKFNWYIGTSLIENSKEKITQKELNYLLTKHKDIEYPTFIYDTFHNTYYTDEENQWLDVVVTNISKIRNLHKRAIAYFALFQSCIIKRPYNLFHRKNLYIRLSDVKRNFGNKVTWDTPFEIHFCNFIKEANNAVFDNGFNNKAFNMNVLDLQNHYDLVYIDTPYISKRGVGVDYFGFYHFLEGLVNYDKWSEMIDYKTKHRKLKGKSSSWTDKNKIFSEFDQLFKKFKDSILVISYRSDGIPSIEALMRLLKKYKSHVKEIERRKYKYVLSTNNSEEVLLIAQ